MRVIMMNKLRRFFLLFLCVVIFNAGIFSVESKTKEKRDSTPAYSDVEVVKLDNNIPVYIKNIRDSNVSSISIVVRGGVLYLEPELSGLELALFTMMCRGSKLYSYEEIQNFEYRTLGGVSCNSGRYGSVLTMNCLNKYFDETLNLFVDAFMAPSFGPKEYDLLIQDYNQNVQHMLNEPSSMLFYYANQMVYDGHPYGVSYSVTPDSIKNITIAELKKLHKQILDSRRISIVATGSFNKKELVKKLNAQLGKIPFGDYELKEQEIPSVKIKGNPVVLSHPNARGTGYILRLFNSPSIHSEDYPVCRLIESIYSNILYNVVREKNGICYTPSSFVSSSDAPYGGEYLYRVSNLTDFKSAIKEAQDIMISGKTISSRDKNGNYIFEDLSSRLLGYKNTYINQKYSAQASVSGVNSRMCAGLLQFDDIEASQKLTEKVKKVSVDDILRVFKKYWLTDEYQWFAVVSPEDEGNLKF